MTALENPNIPITVISEKEAQLDLTNPKDIEVYIGLEATRRSFSPELAQGIARAESHFIPNAKNPVPTASGVYQFLDSTFKDYCIKMYQLTETMKDKDDVKIQVQCALNIMTTDKKGIDHWLASKPNWKQYIPRNGE